MQTIFFSEFQESRGHTIDRENYVGDLMSASWRNDPKNATQKPDHRDSRPYRTRGEPVRGAERASHSSNPGYGQNFYDDCAEDRYNGAYNGAFQQHSRWNGRFQGGERYYNHYRDRDYRSSRDERLPSDQRYLRGQRYSWDQLYRSDQRYSHSSGQQRTSDHYHRNDHRWQYDQHFSRDLRSGHQPLQAQERHERGPIQSDHWQRASDECHVRLAKAKLSHDSDQSQPGGGNASSLKTLANRPT